MQRIRVPLNPHKEDTPAEIFSEKIWKKKYKQLEVAYAVLAVSHAKELTTLEEEIARLSIGTKARAKKKKKNKNSNPHMEQETTDKNMMGV